MTLKVLCLVLPEQTHVTVPFSSRGDAKVSQIYSQIFCIPDRPSRLSLVEYELHTVKSVFVWAFFVRLLVISRLIVDSTRK